ncbi:TIGR01906 family membrane protein [Lachnospiraceae bacterium 46-15]
MKKLFSASNLTLAVIFMLFFISFSVVLVLNFRPLYYHDIEALGIVESSGITEDNIRANYDTLISYNSIFGQKELDFPTLAMSESGKIHFEEVKNIFVFVQWLCITTFFTGAIGLFFKLRKKDAGCLKLAGILTPLVPAVLGGLIALNWENFFVTFHHIFFRNDYWLFNPATDPVITMLPDAFFLHCAIAILVLVILFSLLSLLVSRFLSRHWS